MHLCRDCAGTRAEVRIGRPDAMAREEFVQPLSDRKGVPGGESGVYARLSLPEDRHQARGESAAMCSRHAADSNLSIRSENGILRARMSTHVRIDHAE